MSAGVFINNARYETNRGEIAKIRVQPETLQLELDGVQNEQAAGAITLPVSAVVSKGRRSRGLNARIVRIAWIGAAPAGYDARGIITLPWLNPNTFDQLDEGAVGTYLTFPVRYVGKTTESAK